MYVDVNFVNRSEDKPRNLRTVAIFVILRRVNDLIPEGAEPVLKLG